MPLSRKVTLNDALKVHELRHKLGWRLVDIASTVNCSLTYASRIASGHERIEAYRIYHKQEPDHAVIRMDVSDDMRLQILAWKFKGDIINGRIRVMNNREIAKRTGLKEHRVTRLVNNRDKQYDRIEPLIIPFYEQHEQALKAQLGGL